MKQHSKSKRKWPIEEKFLNLNELPSNVMRTIVEKMSVEEHAVFRGICVYSHDEVESYWRTQKTFSISQLMNWFPSLHDSEWKLNSLSAITHELTSVFNLFKAGNMRKLSLHRVLSVNIKTLIRCIESATGDTASVFLKNVVELDLRGCFIPSDQFKLIDELFPSLQTIILHSNAIIPDRNTSVLSMNRDSYSLIFRKLTIKSKFEITHHVDAFSSAKTTECGNVPGIDMHLVSFIKENVPDVKHIFIDFDS
uniref:F-box domain-containing protein n=1 Tax=Caenorhabditis tropicalis TaxID=1561998 RepID=A0A1I7U843_9PELO